ncbi:MAG: 16S rRNA pseudouridine(516) synthase [Oscillospiraceae bacterium]
MEIIRLDRFVARSFDISRSHAAKLILEGKISFNGALQRDVAFKLSTDDRIVFMGEERGYEKFVYIMMNKPLGIVSSTEDNDGETVIDILPPSLKRRGLFPAGRLDKYSHGMMIITDDGEFAHRMLSPATHVPKTYYIKADAPIVNEKLVHEFSKGVFLGDGKYSSPSQLVIIDEFSAYVTIHEGIYHQVRRMFSRFGGEVTELKRIKIGGLSLDKDLKAGESRAITPKEKLLLTENSEIKKNK